MTCTVCAAAPARYEARFDTMNGRALQWLCTGCLAGALAAHPPHSPNVPRDFQPWEVTDMKRNEPGVPEDEMEELIASKDWPPYYLTLNHCSGRKKGGHKACPSMKQPTNHIDPHPTICTCECHDDERPELPEIRARQAGYTVADDDELILDDEEIDWDEDWEDDELVFDEEDEEEYVFD